MTNLPNEGLHLLISGRVQGVGFRYATRLEAMRLGLCGWVSNRTDGIVEAYFEGTRLSMEEMLQWCHHGPRMASVDNVCAEWRKVETPYTGFKIR